MKSKAIHLVLLMVLAIAMTSCSSSNSPVGPDGGDGGNDTDTTKIDPNAPPLHWYQDFQGWNTMLTRIKYNKHVAIYYDSRVPRTMTWPYQFLQMYGNM